MMGSDVDLGLKIRATFSLAQLEKLLVVVVEVYICPRPSTFPPITQVFMVYVGVYLVLLVMLMILFMKKKEVIVGVMVQDLEVGLKRSANTTLTMMYKVLMVIVILAM